MIFVTVGHQLPFDRLVRAIDAWSARSGRTDVFAQIGKSSFRPTHMDAVSFLVPEEFHRRMEIADAVISHAGTGNIINALCLGKPMLVLPRRSCFGETRNDHQVATARRFGESGHILVASTENELSARIEELQAFRPRSSIDARAAPELLVRLRDFAFGS